jgi:hypothetical protein
MNKMIKLVSHYLVFSLILAGLTGCGLLGGRDSDSSGEQGSDQAASDALDPELIVEEGGAPSDGDFAVDDMDALLAEGGDDLSLEGGDDLGLEGGDDFNFEGGGDDDLLALEDSSGSQEDPMAFNDDSLPLDPSSLSEAPGQLPNEFEESAPTNDSMSGMADSSSMDSFGASSGTGMNGTYTVQSGDTLMKIAFQIYGDVDRWRDIYNQNQNTIMNPNRLEVGTNIVYEEPATPFSRDTSGQRYRIQEGDTLGGIALYLYGRTNKWRKLYERNRDLIKDPDRIYAGFDLYYNQTQEELAEAERVRSERGLTGGNQGFASSPSQGMENMGEGASISGPDDMRAPSADGGDSMAEAPAADAGADQGNYDDINLDEIELPAVE